MLPEMEHIKYVEIREAHIPSGTGRTRKEIVAGLKDFLLAFPKAQKLIILPSNTCSCLSKVLCKLSTFVHLMIASLHMAGPEKEVIRQAIAEGTSMGR